MKKWKIDRLAAQIYYWQTLREHRGNVDFIEDSPIEELVPNWQNMSEAEIIDQAIADAKNRVFYTKYGEVVPKINRQPTV